MCAFYIYWKLLIYCVLTTDHTAVLTFTIGLTVAEILVKKRLLHHGGHGMMRWMVANVVTKKDDAENIKFSKAKAGDKIDGIIAMVMALGEMITMENKDVTGSSKIIPLIFSASATSVKKSAIAMAFCSPSLKTSEVCAEMVWSPIVSFLEVIPFSAEICILMGKWNLLS